MTDEFQSSCITSSCWQKMLTKEFKEDLNERLRFYTSFSCMTCNKKFISSDVWIIIVFKAIQDSWSRIRQVGREILLDGIKKEENNKETYIWKIVNVILYKWAHVKYWYEKDGLLLLLLDLFLLHVEDKSSSDTSLLLSDERMLSYLLFHIALPSVLDVQVSIRGVGVKVIVEIVKRNRELLAFIRDYIFKELTLHLEEEEQRENPRKKEIYEIEGLLCCFLTLVKLHPDVFSKERNKKWWEKMEVFLDKFSIHPAASVRQCIAQIWAFQCDEKSFERLCICSIHESTAHSQEEGEGWRKIEVLLMALQEQLLFFLSSSSSSSSSDGGGGGGKKQKSLIWVQGLEKYISDFLYSILLFSEMKQFEVSRMGKQVLPLCIQFWVRFTSSFDFIKKICSREEEKDGETPFQRCQYFFTLFLPELIWFLALRRYINYHEEKDVDKIKTVISLYIIPFLSETKKGKEEGKESRMSSRPGYSLSVLLVCTYFPDCFVGISDRSLIDDVVLTNKTWNQILSEDINSMKYGVDFALSVRRSGRSVTHLLPVWLQRLPHAYAHQQCLILEMIKIAFGAPKYWISSKLFSFAYHSILDAPTMQDGGEDVSRGFYWLKLFCPTESSLPEMAPFPFHVDTHVMAMPAVLHEVVYTNVYTSKGTEQSVLHIVKAIMLMECEMCQYNKDAVGTVVSAIVGRLENVSPNWRDVLTLSIDKNADDDYDASSSAAEVKNEHVQNTEGRNNNNNNDGSSESSDWDDFDSNSDVEGTSPEEEIREATCLLRVLLNNYWGSSAPHASDEEFSRALGPTEREVVRRLVVMGRANSYR